MGLMGEFRALASYAQRHPIGARAPFGTCARFLSWQLRSRLRPGAHDMPWVNGARLRVRRGMHGATGNLYFGLQEFAEMGFVAHLLRPGDVFADVGANVGSYTVLAAKVCGAIVHAFEPAAETLPALHENVALNGIGDQVTIHPVALGASEGQVTFTRGSDAMNKIADGAGATVPIRRLDDLLPVAPLAIKVDVEGGEPAMIAGAARTLADPALQAIEIETLDASVRRAIEEAGLSQRWYDPLTRALSAAPTALPVHNHLFVRDAAFVEERLRAAPPIRVAGQTI